MPKISYTSAQNPKSAIHSQGQRARGCRGVSRAADIGSPSECRWRDLSRCRRAGASYNRNDCICRCSYLFLAICVIALRLCDQRVDKRLPMEDSDALRLDGLYWGDGVCSYLRYMGSHPLFPRSSVLTILIKGGFMTLTHGFTRGCFSPNLPHLRRFSWHTKLEYHLFCSKTAVSGGVRERNVHIDGVHHKKGWPH